MVSFEGSGGRGGGGGPLSLRSSLTLAAGSLQNGRAAGKGVDGKVQVAVCSAEEALMDGGRRARITFLPPDFFIGALGGAARKLNVEAAGATVVGATGRELQGRTTQVFFLEESTQVGCCVVGGGGDSLIAQRPARGTSLPTLPGVTSKAAFVDCNMKDDFVFEVTFPDQRTLVAAVPPSSLKVVTERPGHTTTLSPS